MYKIYINDRIIVFAKPEEEVEKKFQLTPINYESMDSIFEEKNNVEKLNGWILRSDQIEKIFSELSRKFTLIEAAGGLVKNDQEQFLFIFRKGKWDLPKGKLDKGESIEDAALREVKEECGIKHLHLKGPLTETYHVYIDKGKNMLKRTYWFAMESLDKNLYPQTEEGITEAVWLPKDRFHIAEQNTYPLILDVMGYADSMC